MSRSAGPAEDAGDASPVTLLDQPALNLADARAKLDRLMRRRRGLSLGTILLVLIGAVLLRAGNASLGVSVLLGAAIALGLAALAHGDRGRLLTRLVAQGDAWPLDEVRAFERRLLSPRERARLARGLRQAAIVGVSGVSATTLIPPARAALVAVELARLAALFGDTRRAIDARAAALCRRMLCDAALSPLYNPHLSDSDLTRLVAAIRARLADRP